MDEEKAKKRRRLTLEEQAARIDEKERRLKEQKRELQKKLNAKKRRERTRYLIQLGAITQKFLGDVELSQYEQFLKAIDSKPSENNATIRMFIMRDEKKYSHIMDSSGNPTNKIEKFSRYKTLKSCFESFIKGDWFDFASHETKKKQ